MKKKKRATNLGACLQSLENKIMDLIAVSSRLTCSEGWQSALYARLTRAAAAGLHLCCEAIGVRDSLSRAQLLHPKLSDRWPPFPDLKG